MAVTTAAVAAPAAAQQCRGTKQWFEGACRYPDEIKQLETDRINRAAEARRKAELERRRAEAARQKAELERRKAEEARRKAEEEEKRRQAEEAQRPSEPPTELDLPAEPTAPDPVPGPGDETAPATTPEADRAEIGGVSPLVYVGFGVAGAGLLVGAITGGLSMNQAADLKDRCPGDVCAPDIEGEVDTMMTLGHVSTASFIIAGIGAGVGLVGLLTGGSDEATETEGSVRPMLGPGFAGVTGTF